MTTPIAEMLGLPVKIKKSSPQSRPQAKTIRKQPTTETHTKAEVVAVLPVSGKGKVATREADILKAAGVLSQVRTPEVLPAVPGHPALESKNGGGGPGVGTSMALTKTARRVRALELRAQGLGFREIRTQLESEGFGLYKNGQPTGKRLSLKTVYYDVQESLVYLARLQTSMAEDVRNLELIRLDHMQSKLATFINIGDTYSIMAALAIMKHRAALLGLMPSASGGGGGKKDKDGDRPPPRDLSTLTDTELRRQIAEQAKALGVDLVQMGMEDPEAGNGGGGEGSDPQ